MCGNCLSLPLDQDAQDDYVEQFFDLETASPVPAQPNAFHCNCGCARAYFRPRKFERRSGPNGALLWRILGASLLLSLLKKCSCYPRTIHGTTRGTPERERAMILAVALTVKYESGHLYGLLAHFVAAAVLFIVQLTGDPLDPTWLPFAIFGGQLAIMWFVHLLPVLVQRLNRGRLYFAISEIRAAATETTSLMSSENSSTEETDSNGTATSTS
jgi:hypothetical protein